MLLAKLLPNASPRAIPLTLRGGQILQIRDFWSIFLFDEIYVQNCYEPFEVLKRGPFGAIIDIGANIGLFTLRAKQLWPEVPIVAIEPHPENFRRLTAHIELNQLRDVQPIQAGVAEECGCLELFVSPRNIAGHSMYKKSGAVSAISVPVRSLQSILAETHPYTSRLLLKIDCEGCEYAILSTLDQATSARVACIIFEPEPSLYDIKALCEHLRNLGFTVSRFRELIVATNEVALARQQRNAVASA